jgi:hypothetical protein
MPHAADDYLNDHLAGAAAAIQLAERCRDREPDTEFGQLVGALLGEIDEDRAVLERVLAALGGSVNQVKRATALGVEHLSSLRAWIPVLGARSDDVARLEEIEVLTLGIEGKRLLWRALGSVESDDDRLRAFDFAALEQRAIRQRDRLEELRLKRALVVFSAQ